LPRPRGLLWEEYTQVQEENRNFAMRKVGAADEIFPVFRELFKKGVKP